MNKTKVRLSPYLLAYRTWMAQRVDQTREARVQAAACAGMILEPLTAPTLIPFNEGGILPPPCIEALIPDIDVQKGETIGLIQINISDLFLTVNVLLTLRDEAGNLLESGSALKNEDCDGHWGYFPSAPLKKGQPLVVRAVATDALGGLAVVQENYTVGD